MKLDQSIEFHIKTTSLALTRMYNQMAEMYGITQTIGYILTYVKKEGTPSTKLATDLGMKKSSLTRLLKKMEIDGCIYRKIESTDKRVVKVFLTERGIERKKIAKKKVLDFNQLIINNIKDEEWETFIKVSNIIKKVAAQEELKLKI